MNENLSLLIVDDRNDNIIVLSSLIREYFPQYDIFSATNATEGLRIAAEMKVDCALIDVQMPEMDGVEMCRRLKADAGTRHIHIILLTAHRTSPEIRAKGLEAGADDFIHRPFDNVEFVARIKVISRIITAEKKSYEMNEQLETLLEEKSSELIASEKKYRTLFEQAGDYILLLEISKNGDLNIVDVNRAACAMHGYARQEMIGKPITFVDSELDEGEIRAFTDRLLSGESLLFETTHMKKDGTKFPVEISANLLEIQDGPPIILSIERDLTERKQSEREKEELKTHLYQVQKMEAIGTLAGGIAHDFNNLLAIIRGNVDMIQLKKQSGKSSKVNIEHIYQATVRATDLVKQILAFSRQEQYEFSPIDLSIAVQDAFKLLRSTTPSTIEIEMEIDAEFPLIINANAPQLQQIFINLCSNAVHAMAGKGLLQVNLGQVEFADQNIPAGTILQAGRYAKFAISDSGTGINNEIADRIFDPFFTTKAVGEGTGMGLSMANGIIEQHGGSITVDSTLGHGCTFIIYLPLISENTVKPMIESVEGLPTGSEKILFVDDEECIAFTFNQLLVNLGYKVTSSSNSNEALDIFKANPQEFDLVFTDQTMPRLTGSQLSCEILKIRPDTPIILSTGYSDVISEDEALALGIRAYLSKPVKVRVLLQTIQQILA